MRFFQDAIFEFRDDAEAFGFSFFTWSESKTDKGVCCWHLSYYKAPVVEVGVEPTNEGYEPSAIPLSYSMIAAGAFLTW